MICGLGLYDAPIKKVRFTTADEQGSREVVAEFEKFLRATGFDLGSSKFALVDFTTLGEMEYEQAERDFEELMGKLGNDDDGSDDQSH